MSNFQPLQPLELTPLQQAFAQWDPASRPIIQVVGWVTTLVLAWYTVNKSARINQRNKRADVAMHCNNRYDVVRKTKHELRSGSTKSDDPVAADMLIEANASSYYSNLWGLKSDEFDYWLEDLLDLETYANWCFMGLQGFGENTKLYVTEGRHAYRWGWKEVGSWDHQTTNPWFHELTDAMYKMASLWPNSENQKQITEERMIEVRWQFFRELIELLEIVHQRSEFYRSRLLNGISFSDYKKVLRQQRRLNLLSDNAFEEIKMRIDAVINAKLGTATPESLTR